MCRTNNKQTVRIAQSFIKRVNHVLKMPQMWYVIVQKAHHFNSGMPALSKNNIARYIHNFGGIEWD